MLVSLAIFKKYMNKSIYKSNKFSWLVEFLRERKKREALRDIEVFEIWDRWSGLSLSCWPLSLAGEFVVVSDIMLVPLEGRVGAVSEPSMDFNLWL